MITHVIVAFGKEQEYQFKFSPADLAQSTPEEARRWFDKEYSDLKCEPVTPMGKVLIIDKILEVARRGGAQRFIDGKSWAEHFARYAALTLARDTIRVDVESSKIGY